MNKILYYSYGSNMSQQRMIDRGVIPLSTRIAFLEDYKFIINKKSFKNPSMGFANIIPSLNDKVEGILYEVYDSDLKLLDRFEGAPNHYGRETLKLKLIDNSVINAIVYVANPEWVSKTELKTTNKYKNYILEGRKYISENYFNFLNENIKT